jgi:ATP-dependent Lon protease
VLAARRAGIREVILPRQNEKNVNEDLTEELRKELTIHFVQSVDEVLLLALTPAVKASGDKKTRVQPRVQ